MESQPPTVTDAHSGDPCPHCKGCGQVADTDNREPWTAWTSLPVSAAMAVILGNVKPITCDDCDGTGKLPVEPEPNSQLSEYGKQQRARFELAAKHAEQVLPPAFYKRFHAELSELLERDWNHFGAVDSFVANSKIPYVVDVLRWAEQKSLLSDEDRQLVPPEVSR
jgi:hypothetical protein